MTRILIALGILAALAALCCLASFALLLAAEWRKMPRDLTSESLEGTRFEKYAAHIIPDVEAMRALPWEDVFITSFDNTRLHARLLRGSAEAVVLVHGYHSSPENDFAGIAQWYASRGMTVLAVDQRAHGLSGGRRLTFGGRERRDALAWAQYAEHGLGAERIWLHGVSMGASTLLYAMGEGLPERVRGVVADCPFDEPVTLLAMHLKKRAGLPAFPLIKPCAAPAWRLLNGMPAGYACHEAAAKSETPLLLLEAGEDGTVPPGGAAAIRAGRNNRDAAVTFPHAHHALCWQEDSEKYAEAIERFLNRTRGG